MPAFLHDSVLDAGLTLLDTEIEDLFLCSQMPANFTEASVTYALATKAAPVVNAPSDRVGGGREIVIDSFVDGVVSDAGIATHFALCSDDTLLVANTLTAPKTFTEEDTVFDMEDIHVGIPDAV